MFEIKVAEKIKTHIPGSIFFFETRTVYAIMWENTESTVASPLQQRLHERASMFRSTYIANLVKSAKLRKNAALRFSTPGRLGIGDNKSKLEKVSYSNLLVISASFSNNLSK
jgi:hypothetical protein